LIISFFLLTLQLATEGPLAYVLIKVCRYCCEELDVEDGYLDKGVVETGLITLDG